MGRIRLTRLAPSARRTPNSCCRSVARARRRRPRFPQAMSKTRAVAAQSRISGLWASVRRRDRPRPIGVKGIRDLFQVLPAVVSYPRACWLEEDFLHPCVDRCLRPLERHPRLESHQDVEPVGFPRRCRFEPRWTARQARLHRNRNPDVCSGIDHVAPERRTGDSDDCVRRALQPNRRSHGVGRGSQATGPERIVHHRDGVRLRRCLVAWFKQAAAVGAYLQQRKVRAGDQCARSALGAVPGKAPHPPNRPLL